MLPGDYCNDTIQCYDNAYGAKCVGGKWVASKKIGESCFLQDFSDNYKCPEDSYCTADTKIWAPTLKEGEDCSDFYKYCGYGTECFGNADGTSYRCSKLYKAPVGTRFKFDLMKGSNLIISANSYCQSGYYFAIDTLTGEWRPQPKSNDTTEAKLRRDEAGTLCYYTTYADPKATFEVPVVKADLSSWGFNADNYSWWNKRLGDSYYT